jgi:uncharacterized protein YecE (DUF72 family)
MSRRRAADPFIRLGLSGWSNPFPEIYPKGTRPADRLGYYSRAFQSVEVNSSFYGVPSPSTLESWRRRTPEGFEFSVKASRLITHLKRLASAARETRDFVDRCGILGDKLGPILFQLPPNGAFDAERFEEFLSGLPAETAGRPVRYAFEFREKSWFRGEAYALLERYGAALCLYDLAGFESPIRLTVPWSYVRLHGPGASKYVGSYSTRALEPWADLCRRWVGDGRDVYFYFDNTADGSAVGDAFRFRQLLLSQKARAGRAAA